jgi:mono/diheme cytochrome c family protein
MKPIQTNLLISTLLLVSIALGACAAPPNVSAANAAPSPTPLPLPGAVATEPAAAVSGSVEMPGTSADLTGASLFQLSCSACHGQDRAGSTFEVDGQTIQVPALTWDDLNSTYATDPSRGSVPAQVALAITKGQDESGESLNAMMPHWSSLSQAQVDSLVQLIQAGGTVGTAELSPVATSLKGEQLYLTSCAACHGVDGTGKTFEVDGNTITTPSLSWSDMSKTYATDPSRGSVEDQLALAITKGQDESGEDLPSMMPRWSFLSKEQVDSLVQYIQSAFK